MLLFLLLSTSPHWPLFPSPTHSLLKPTGSFSPLFQYLSCVCVWWMGRRVAEMFYGVGARAYKKWAFLVVIYTRYYMYFMCCSTARELCFPSVHASDVVLLTPWHDNLMSIPHCFSLHFVRLTEPAEGMNSLIIS